MRIVHILGKASRQAGGLFETVPGLAQSLLSQSGVRVSALGIRDENTEEDQGRWPCPIHFLPAARWAPRKLLYAPGMLQRLLAEDASVLFCHGLWVYYNYAALRWMQLTRRPCIVVPHGMLDVVDLRKSRLQKWVARRLYVGPLLQNSACIRAISGSEAKSVRAYGVRAPICLIPNGMVLPPQANPQPPEWRRSFPPNAKVLFYIGRINPKKGLPALVEAWSRTRAERASSTNPWRLVIAGWDQGGHEALLKSQARELSIQDSVHFVGPLFDSAKDAAFRHSDAFVLPSTSEGLPTVVLEAWAYRLPVLMTPECNIPEGFSARAAIRIETNPASIAAGLLHLFNMSPPERETMAANGHAMVATRFCWAAVAQQIMAVCRWTLGLGPKPACVVDG